MRKYTDRIRVWIKPEDRELIKKKMEEAGIKNMSAYIRKMAIDGYVIRLDMSDVKEVSRLLRINANNINQYAKRANETGNIYLEDIRDIQQQLQRQNSRHRHQIRFCPDIRLRQKSRFR